jgi:hypothetical protein
MLKRAGLFTYTWDFVDEGVNTLLARIRDLGVTRILLTSLYHAGFFMHPHNPKRRTYLLEDGVAYFHPNESRYSNSVIKPVVASMCKDTDWFGEICERASDVGLGVSAWMVCFHNTRLGLLHPDATIRNVYGDSYPHAMSPAHPDARAFVHAVAGDLAERYSLLSVMVEAPDYRSRLHGGTWVSGHHHERDGVYLRPLEQALLDLSFNDADVEQASNAGVDVERLRRAVRAHMDRYFDEAPTIPTDLPETIEQFAQDVPLAGYEAHMRRTEETVLAELAQIVREHGVKLEGKASPSVDMALSGGYGETPQRMAQLVAQTKRTLTADQELGFTVRMGYNHPGMGWAMQSEQDTCAAVRAIADAGADEVLFYNYGEAPRRAIDWIAPALQSAGFRG